MNVPRDSSSRKRVPCITLKRVQHSSGSTDEPMPAPEERAGRELRRLRLARGWSQEQVAERMKAFGYDWHQTLIGRIEAAQRPLRLNEAADLASLFEVPLEALTFMTHYRLPEEVDAEIETLRRAYDAAALEWSTRKDDLHARRVKLEAEMEAVRRESDRLEGAVRTLASRIESLEERYGKRP